MPTSNVRELSREEVKDYLPPEVTELIITHITSLIGQQVMIAVLAYVEIIDDGEDNHLNIELYGRGLFVLTDMQWLHFTCDNPHITWKRPEDWIGIQHLQPKDPK